MEIHSTVYSANFSQINANSGFLGRSFSAHKSAFRSEVGTFL